MSGPTSRVLTLLELLQSGGTRTLAELADRLGVDPRTVRRYVDHLTDLGVPVEAVRGRYGGYRLGRGHRLPPLALTDDEALAVLLALAAGRRAGLPATASVAGETAAAKIRRVLPERVACRLAALLDTVAFTGPERDAGAPDADTLLTVADAARHHRPLAFGYADRHGRRTHRVLHPRGIVAHAGRWYLTGVDPALGEERTFRLDRVGGARVLPGAFAPLPDGDPAERLVAGFATAAYRHEVRLRIHGTVAQIRAGLPASVARIDDAAQGADAGTAPGEGGADERWRHVRIRAERLDWLPPVLASLDRPFVVESPAELRERVAAFADRLAGYARTTGPTEPVPPRPEEG
ncbi:helix-turn-helix transcriptional regulator [Streptomyces sp. NPDC020917]|uniref:helix-turn-helix transcriptional regulator n=1 Tax=Streptomyces sp. NPDC020917 TaxID=3365102 RepID=UPI0037AE8498